ncbi:hypothetical protein AGOR_G00249020 [Albula goreensis]|uniref:G2 and S phase-expressed protein 1 N-terminal domain-containing protein n=1 Tax=Albula goreensis TaxID=1534307 RepID=A0A8T3CEH5_9TELE|nr:hypothetical protein AGOR_G00249020 [Albula goreensis]
MASQTEHDFVSLAEEKFDFDLPLSPASEKGSEEEEDEVFLGPVGHKEKCISVGIENGIKEVSSASSGPLLSLELGSWSPLTGDKFDQIIQEANLLAQEIEKNVGDQPVTREDSKTAAQDKQAECFVEDSSSKLSALSQQPGSLVSPIKRETFCIQDSPMKQLPPAIQQRILKTGGVPSPGRSTAQKSVRNPSSLKSTQSSVQPRVALRGKATLSCGRGLLPSRPSVPGVTQPSAAKSRLAPPDKGRAGRKHSPLGRTLSSAGSSEDLLSDTASVASDISDSSFNTSLPGRRGLTAPSKAGLRAPPAMKAPPLQGRRVVDRRTNTSSSSSSVSSLNSSLSISPLGKGKFNTSLSSVTQSGTKSRGPNSMSRLSNSVAASTKSRAPSAPSAAPEPVRAGKQLSSAQGKKPAEPQARLGKSTPIKRPDPGPSNHTPAKRPAQRAVSVPSIPAASAAKTSGATKSSNPKPKAFVAPTPTNQVKGPRRSEVPSPDLSRIMKPKRFASASSTEGLHQKAGVPAPEAHQTPTISGKSGLLRRSSALPTPVNRRISGIPMMTPKGVKMGQNTEKSDLPASARKISQGSPIQVKVIQRPSTSDPKTGSGEEPSGPAMVQPCSLVFSLEDESEGTPMSVLLPSTPELTPQHAAEHPAEHSLQDQNTSESSTGDLNTPETSTEDHTTPETSTDNHTTPEVTENLISPEFSTEKENTVEPNTEKRGLPSSEEPQNQESKTPENKEILLVDAPAPVLKTEERLLIDLSNTPDLMRSMPLKPTGDQLIDLSSPLITWSPIDKKENIPDSPPLINLSF